MRKVRQIEDTCGDLLEVEHNQFGDPAVRLRFNPDADPFPATIELDIDGAKALAEELRAFLEAHNAA